MEKGGEYKYVLAALSVKKLYRLSRFNLFALRALLSAKGLSVEMLA